MYWPIKPDPTNKVEEIAVPCKRCGSRGFVYSEDECVSPLDLDDPLAPFPVEVWCERCYNRSKVLCKVGEMKSPITLWNELNSK